MSAPVRIRTNRFGHLEEHELIKLLDTIEDERARGRFRESIYISMFVWVAIAWVLFYGPKYLWHSPQLISPAQALQQQALVQLNAPRLPHHAVAPPPKIDRGTLAKLRAMEPKPAPACACAGTSAARCDRTVADSAARGDAANPACSFADAAAACGSEAGTAFG